MQQQELRQMLRIGWSGVTDSGPAMPGFPSRPARAASWLFPGQVPGRYLSANGLVHQLNTHGIQARNGRSAALINPAAVLADLLGLYINTAVRWVKRARRDWASYLAARVEATRTGKDRNTEGPAWAGVRPGCVGAPVQVL